MGKINPSKRRNDCHGCVHEAVEPCKTKNLHLPSGETACINCSRNPPKPTKDNYFSVHEWRKELKETWARVQRRENKV